jgi:mucin-19
VVTAKAITVSGVAANDKVYDGANTANMNVAGAVFNGMVAGDALSVTAAGNFASADVAYSGSTVAAQTVTFANTYGGADVANYTYAGSATTTTAKVTPKALTLDSVVAANKVYDGGLTATISNFGAFTGVVGSDAVALNSSAYAASFATKQVANGKAVTVLASSLGLTGAKAGNYQLVANPSSTADITPKAINVQGIAANDKVYDGDTTATISTAAAVFNGMVGGDALSLSATGTFANKTVASGKTVTLVSSYGGADLANYSITHQASTTASITAKALTISGLVADSRVYNGGTATTVTNTNALFTGLVSGDAVTVSATGEFADKNVGTGKTVTLTSTSGGADVANYSITHQATSSANITPKALSISGITAANKVYDNTTAAAVSVSSVVTTGLVLNDVVTVSATGVFSDENVATGKTVTLTSSYAGADRNNYNITNQATTTANITALDLDLSGSTGLTKVYDATAAIAPALSGGATGYGALGVTAPNNATLYADALTTDSALAGGLSITGTPVLSSANAGTVSVEQGSVQLSGTRAGNYRLVWSNGAANTITKAPLTITANDDAKFYSQADSTTNYEGVRYSGFVGGQTSTVLGGSLAVTRDRSALLTADPSSVATQDSAGCMPAAWCPQV